MVNNPFTSNTYQNIWQKHFASDNNVIKFDCIEDLYFYKKKWLPLFVNFGRNMTNGITYKVLPDTISIKDSVLLIYDVPSHYKINLQDNCSKLIKVPQYFGYLNKLDNYENIDAFLNTHFDSKQRSKFRNYFNKLDNNHSVVYEVLNKNITNDEYISVMQEFKELLQTRFDDLGIENDILQKWDFYLELIFPLIKENKALLNIIKIDGRIGAISLAFLSENSIIGAIKAFDIKFKKYGLGKLELIKLIEYGINSKYSVLDLSKGDQDYKKRFIDACYVFDCHIIYDSNSLFSIIIANTLKYFFKFKQFLRDQNINNWYWRMRHKFRFKL